MSFMDKVREKARSFLRIEPAYGKQISIRETLDYQGNAIKNRIWYRGDAVELSQLYQCIAEGEERHMFWASRPTPGMEIRKIHTGLPATIVNTLAGIVVTNLNDFAFADKEQEELWNRIAGENDIKALIQRAVTETLYIGDGAFKVSLDSEISRYPILEYYPGDRVEYTHRRGRLTEIIFRSELRTEAGKRCELREIYGMNYVRYKLTMNGEPIDMTAVPALAGLRDVTFGTEDRRYMMAVPISFSRSDRWEGRGQSIFDTKIDAFDAYDEAWSQWMDALRAGRAKTYIPENLIPRDPRTGALKRPNAFDDRFIRTESNMMQGAESRITTEQPQIPHDSYAATYATALDMCLQGLISPSTLGIDVKKLDNAEAQREKEKVTLYTRNRIDETLQADLKQLVEVAILACHEAAGTTMTGEVKVDVTFGDYANPSFESQVETLSKARNGGLMSTEAAVDELYGDTQSAEWKADEVKRIKQEGGVELMPEPAVNLDIINGYGV